MKLNVSSNRTGQLPSTGLTASDYKQYDQRQHVYMKPDTYIGSEMKVEREEWLFDLENRKMLQATIDFVPGCERIFLEILTNASDAVGRSRRAGVEPGKIEIAMDNKTISVLNYGLPIPIEIHPEKQVYIPEMIFGSLLTSSNYEVERHEAGTNGIGAKAACIFSKQFAAIVHDHIRHLKYTQVWSNNMVNKTAPHIEEYTGDKSSVQIIYELDFERFRYDPPNGTQGGYTAEAFALYSRHAVDISFTAKTIVVFNGQELNYCDIREYSRCYFGDNVNNAVVHYLWPEGTEVVKKKKGFQVPKDPSITPIVELIAIDTPDEGVNVSFVNCMMTRDGGVHVNAAVKAIGEPAVKVINDAVLKKLTRQNKGKELDSKTKRSQTININDVKSHISILLSIKVVNPVFDSQSKTKLSASLMSQIPKIHLSEDELKPIGKWQLIDRLFAALEAKQFATLSKNNGKLKRYLKLLKGVDANQAGKAKRSECTLYVTEGKSGACYVNKLIGMLPGGRDFAGVYPAKGKGLNVMNAGSYQIGKNVEIKELMKMMGLEFCPEDEDKNTYYLNPAKFNKLRYGKGLIIMSDSDVDGKHIIGLILNMFYCFFPSLLARGYVKFCRTPILRTTFNRHTEKFYTMREYNEWKDRTPNYERWTHAYYKGLGTSSDADIKDDFRTQRIVNCVYDADAPGAIIRAFDKHRADERKDWVGCYQPVNGVDDIPSQPISWFINHELILFSIADIQRSLPKLVDGFKESQRKIIKGADLKWKLKKNGTYTKFKVAQFAGYVTEQTNYQHGEVNLNDVIVGLTQDFTGSNNIPWFIQDGQFGCVHPDTPILLWNKSTKLAKDITDDDVLIGDDGEPRHISKIVSGFDEMYDVVQEYGTTYRVNSLHILTLYFPDHKRYYWKNNAWHLIYYDALLKKVQHYTSAATSFLSKDDAKDVMLLVREMIPDGNIFDIDIRTYLSFSESDKNLFKSVHNYTPVNWPDNTVESRLKQLADLVDNCGTVLSDGSIEVSSLTTDMGYLVHSLGFKLDGNVISGDTIRIPSEKLINGNSTPYIGSDIEVIPAGPGDYVGWYIDGNERFLLGDWTVTHNTRYELGKDSAQTRYSFVRPNKIFSYIIRKEDKPVLTALIDEGMEVEPDTYYPVIPMILVNGSQGIGTGYSTFVPAHNPLDIINWLKLKLTGTSDHDLPHIVPWYRGFTGTIKVIDRRNRKKKGGARVTVINHVDENGLNIPVVQEIEEPDNHDATGEILPGEEGFEEQEAAADDNQPRDAPGSRPLLSMVSLGKFHMELNGTIVITELPIGRSPISYHKWLEDLVENKKITGYRDQSIDNTVYFEITGFKDQPTCKTLKLQRTKGMSNMTLLDENNRPIRYDTTYDILEAFFCRRLFMYQKRKDHILAQIIQDIEVINHKIMFIRAVLSGQIVFIGKSKASVYASMDALGIPREIFDKSMNHHLTEDDIANFYEQIRRKEETRDEVARTTVEQMWLKELDELEEVYRSINGLKKKGLTLLITK